MWAVGGRWGQIRGGGCGGGVWAVWAVGTAEGVRAVPQCGQWGRCEGALRAVWAVGGGGGGGGGGWAYTGAG